MYNFNKILSIAFIFLGISIAYPTENKIQNKCNSPCEAIDPCECRKCEPCEPCCDTPKAPTLSAYNETASIKVCNSVDFFVTASFLLIKPYEEQMEVGEFINNPNHEIKTIPFDWKAAFKVGLGYSTDFDNWIGFIDYLRINTHMKNGFSKNGYRSINNLWGLSVLDLEEINSKWELDFNIFNFNLSRLFYNSPKIKMNINYGLKAGWIDQKLNLEFIDKINEVTINNLVTDSYLIGPRIGITSTWNIYKDINLIGQGAGSIFYQKFYRAELEYIDVDAEFTNFRSSYINSSLEGIFGLNYSSYILRNLYHLDITLGYEIQIFFNQNMMRYLQPSPYSGAKTSTGNLMFHGLNLTTSINF